MNSKFDRAPLLTVLDEDIKVGGEYPRAEVSRRQAVGRDRARGAGREAQAIRVVGVDDEVSIGRQGFDEPFESREDIVEGSVEVRMVELDVGDDGSLGFEVEERLVALVGLGDEEVRASGDDVAPDVVQLAADEGGGVLAQSLEDMSRHARGRGFSVGTGDGYAPATREDTGESRSSGYHWDRAPPSLEKLGVRGRDGGGDHPLLGVPDLVGGVPDVPRFSCVLDPSGVWSLLEVRAGDDV